MDGRSVTAFPSKRNNRYVTDVTFHQSLVNAEKKPYKYGAFSYGNPVPRPFTTIGRCEFYMFAVLNAITMLKNFMM